jgi:hypothetical protein
MSPAAADREFAVVGMTDVARGPEDPNKSLLKTELEVIFVALIFASQAITAHRNSKRSKRKTFLLYSSS